ncbi:hypothetical protein TWF569_004710 [Orbilia oligospora]|nr:hypothetical protein TWF569_004710 [Orbilia oligospora]
MHIKYAAALAIVALVPEISGHAVWDNAIGDADPTIRGYVIGKQYKLENRKGTGQIPFQQDIPVLKNPIVPPTAKSKWWKKPRVYWANGCGATIIDQNTWWSTHKDKKMRDAYAKLPANQRNVIIYQIPVKKMLDWAAITKTMAKTNQIVKSCRYDELFPFTVTIPKNIKCNGSYEGKKNICMLRCENYALNGPFGGCLPFQLIPPEPQAPPPPPPPVPDNSQNIGNTTEADKVKLTDKEAKEVVAAAGPEEVDEAGDPAENVKSEAAVANTNDVKEDKAAADKADDDDDDEKTDGKDTPAEDTVAAAAAKRFVKRVVKRDADDDAVKVALGGEDAPPAMIKIAKQQLKKVPAVQKAQLRQKFNAGKTANKAGAKKGN